MSDGRRRQVHYIHNLQYSTRERLVGVFVLSALLVILALLFVNSRTSHLFESRVTFHAYVNNAQGVTTDSRVKISGIEVGRVSSLDIDRDNRIHIIFYVYERFHDLLRSDSRASLSKLSVLGNASIDISAGSPHQPVLPEGTTLSIDEPLSMDELMAELTPVMQKVKIIVTGVAELVSVIRPDQMASMSGDLAQTAANLRTLSDQVASGKGSVGRAVFDDALAEDLRASVNRLAAVLGEANARLVELGPVMDSAHSLSGEGTQLAGELTTLVKEGRQTVNQMNVALGTVNVELQQLPELVSRMKMLMEATDRTLQGLQRIWPLSSAVPPSGDGTLIEVAPTHE